MVRDTKNSCWSIGGTDPLPSFVTFTQCYESTCKRENWTSCFSHHRRLSGQRPTITTGTLCRHQPQQPTQQFGRNPPIYTPYCDGSQPRCANMAYTHHTPTQRCLPELLWPHSPPRYQRWTRSLNHLQQHKVARYSRSQEDLLEMT